MAITRTPRSLPKTIRNRLTKIFASAGVNEIPKIIWEICTAVDEGIARQLKGPYSALILARIRGISARESMKSAEGGHISVAEAARRLNTSPAQIKELYRNGRIIGWRDGRQVRLPVWQFSRTGLLPGMDTILEALRPTAWNDDWARMLFFLGEVGSLDGRRPLDLLRQKRIEKILPLISKWDD